MEKNVLSFKNRILLVVLGVFLNIPIAFSQESSKVLFKNAIENIRINGYPTAIENLKKLYNQNYCNTDAIAVLLSYTLVMSNKTPTALSYIDRVDTHTFSNELLAFSNNLEALIKGEGPNLTNEVYQNLLDYISPQLSGQSQHVNDIEKERFLIRREYMKRYFEYGYESLQWDLSTSDSHDSRNSFNDGWGEQVYVLTEEEYRESQMTYWERAYYGIEECEISWDQPFDYGGYGNDTASEVGNGIIDQFITLFDGCE